MESVEKQEMHLISEGVSIKFQSDRKSLKIKDIAEKRKRVI